MLSNRKAMQKIMADQKEEIADKQFNIDSLYERNDSQNEAMLEQFKTLFVSERKKIIKIITEHVDVKVNDTIDEKVKPSPAKMKKDEQPFHCGCGKAYADQSEDSPFNEWRCDPVTCWCVNPKKRTGGDTASGKAKKNLPKQKCNEYCICFRKGNGCHNPKGRFSEPDPAQASEDEEVEPEEEEEDDD